MHDDGMVEKQLRSRGIRDERVLQAMQKVPRHLFVPKSFRSEAYADGPLPIGYDQTISQPYIVAYMTEALQVEPGDRVLEIGTGSGYQTAVLAELAREVSTVEILEPLQKEAKDRLRELGYQNIFFEWGDGRLGWPEKSPFDKIMVTAAASVVPDTLAAQLKEGGRMVLPLGEENQQLVLGFKKGGRLQTTPLLPVRFVPLIHGAKKMGGKERDNEKEG